MKDFILSIEEYENVKKVYTTLKLSNLGELNQIYNFQNTIRLCKIFEQRSCFKKYFGTIHENAIAQVAFLDVFIGTIASVVLHPLRTLNMSEHLKKLE